MGLQHVFNTPALSEKVFELLEKRVSLGKKKTGRPGMDLWHILVLAVLRQGLNTNWDRLEDLANNHKTIRQILGVHVEKFGIEETEFCYQTIVDNVSLINEETLHQINTLVAQHGHALLKKSEDEPFQLKTDSFVVETNVHFPTDLNLLWDSIRKCLDMIIHLKKIYYIEDWRKIKDWRKKFKSLFRSTSEAVFKGRDADRKKKKVNEYLEVALDLKARCEVVVKKPPVGHDKQETIDKIIASLQAYCDYATKFCDQIERRLIKGEEIPADEKVYSIFEPHTEWLYKGKLNKNVELGHNVMITTTQHGIIVDYQVMEKQRDPAQVVPLLKRLKSNYPGVTIYSASFDKGYYSKDNHKAAVLSVSKAVMPKKGKLNKEEKAREADETFKQLRNKHSAVESNINMLEHHGLNRCVDKGIDGFKRYVGISVLAYNLHIIGNHIKKEEIKRLQMLAGQRERYARQAA
jgi:hypothetical protein